MFFTQDNSGATSFDNHAGAHPRSKIKVSKKIGDEACKELGVNSVDLVKIDTEGHEAFVLQGLKQTIRQHRPYVIVEWNNSLTVERFAKGNVLNDIFADYCIFVLGYNFDARYWHGHPLAKIRHRLTKIFFQRKVRLYNFDPAKVYRDILLLPRDKLPLLPSEGFGAGLW